MVKMKQWENFIYGWITLLEAFLIILSFGFFEPEFAWAFEDWCMSKDFERKRVVAKTRKPAKESC